jgi:hypothetical protein
VSTKNTFTDRHQLLDAFFQLTPRQQRIVLNWCLDNTGYTLATRLQQNLIRILKSEPSSPVSQS